MTEKKHVILTNIDTELWAKFKGTCYTHGQSMNEVVSRLIRVISIKNHNEKLPS
jgi:hypothetical protein